MATEGGEVVDKQSSYTYWVRETREDAAPLPVPKKLTAEDISKQSQANTNSLGSVWNQAGTWEEKNLNTWASNIIKELLSSLGTLEFSSGNANIDEVSTCSGDISLETRACIVPCSQSCLSFIFDCPFHSWVDVGKVSYDGVLLFGYLACSPCSAAVLGRW